MCKWRHRFRPPIFKIFFLLSIRPRLLSTHCALRKSPSPRAISHALVRGVTSSGWRHARSAIYVCRRHYAVARAESADRWMGSFRARASTFSRRHTDVRGHDGRARAVSASHVSRPNRSRSRGSRTTPRAPYVFAYLSPMRRVGVVYVRSNVAIVVMPY